MTPLYTEEDLKNATCRQLLPLKCEYCSKVFYSPKNMILIVLAKRGSQHTLQFCSISCSKMNRGQPPVKIICEQCSKELFKNKNQFLKTKHHFCSRSCSVTYHNLHKTKGTRVSQLEKYIQQELIRKCPNLIFDFNKTDTINAELDIYIPSLKLAFELNGIFHYEPIYGKDKLNSTKTNDNRKIIACAEKGISLCIIDTSSQKTFKEKTSQKFLQIIIDIIDQKIVQ